MSKHMVVTYGPNNELIYEASFINVDKAHAEYVDIVNNLTGQLVGRKPITVVRYRDGYVMAMTQISE